MNESRRQRIRRGGRIRFILLYGVCGWGLLFGLAFAIFLVLPAFLLMRWLGPPMGPWDAWLCFGIPMLLSAIGGFKWGSGMWEVFGEQPPDSQLPHSSS